MPPRCPLRCGLGPLRGGDGSARAGAHSRCDAVYEQRERQITRQAPRARRADQGNDHAERAPDPGMTAGGRQGLGSQRTRDIVPRERDLDAIQLAARHEQRAPRFEVRSLAHGGSPPLAPRSRCASSRSASKVEANSAGASRRSAAKRVQSSAAAPAKINATIVMAVKRALSQKYAITPSETAIRASSPQPKTAASSKREPRSRSRAAAS